MGRCAPPRDKLHASLRPKQDQEELEAYENNKKIIQRLGPFTACEQRYGRRVP